MTESQILLHKVLWYILPLHLMQVQNVANLKQKNACMIFPLKCFLFIQRDKYIIRHKLRGSSLNCCVSFKDLGHKDQYKGISQSWTGL